MSNFEIVREKLDQAVEVLAEKEIDLWITFVRETTQAGDPCMDLLLGFDLTWESALMISRLLARANSKAKPLMPSIWQLPYLSARWT